MAESVQARVIRAPRGTQLSAKSWLTEAPLRMLMNNLDPEVAERPEELVVYGGIGKAARNWECYERIVESLRALEADESLLIQSGKPVGVFRTHPDAPRVLIANSNLVPKWATWDHFNELDRKGLMMYGQMTAGSWIGRDHLDAGSVASPNRETEAMKDGSDAVSDWALLNLLLNCASGATWVSFHHGGGVGMGYSQHAGMVVVCDGTEAAARRIERVLWNDPASGVMRHADAGSEEALACAREQGLDLPMLR
jgi:urocanate hydratase